MEPVTTHLRNFPLSVLLLLFTPFLLFFLYSQFPPNLSHIPGSPLTQYTNLPRLLTTLRARTPTTHISLHAKYGPIVRLGPQMVSISDPTALQIIYSSDTTKPAFTKTPQFHGTAETATWYKGKPLPLLTAAQDVSYHARLVRASASAFKAGSNKTPEKKIKELVDQVLEKLNKQSHSPRDPSVIDEFAFDATGIIVQGSSLGFVSTGKDVGFGWLALSVIYLYLSVVSQISWVHKYLMGSKAVQMLIGGFSPILRFSVASVEKVWKEAKIGDEGEDESFLHNIKRVNSGFKEPLTEEEIICLAFGSYVVAPLAVGITLRSILYYLARNPSVYERLQREINVELSGDEFTVAEARKLVYLDAVIMEALRMHPVLGFVLERVVPKGGTELSGKYLPEGTVVGINPWVLMRNKGIYGHDADEFRPERWLEATPEKLKEMKRYNLSFGAGIRACKGKDIAMMEILTFVPALMRRFDFRLQRPNWEWSVLGRFFTPQSGMDMKIHALFNIPGQEPQFHDFCQYEVLDNGCAGIWSPGRATFRVLNNMELRMFVANMKVDGGGHGQQYHNVYGYFSCSSC
ncbi:cytochrome P450 [Podospora fimiseda]|uniref:Cytochrome P450 n=1 Tax=Podospora fimiseda TaxID=252190 RepID=A0AAN6YR74_9PEZI|nr:cytochrome P450 [Podospora fimiseda]